MALVCVTWEAWAAWETSGTEPDFVVHFEGACSHTEGARKAGRCTKAVAEVVMELLRRSGKGAPAAV